jgi:NAD-dependent deacetylase
MLPVEIAAPDGETAGGGLLLIRQPPAALKRRGVVSPTLDSRFPSLHSRTSMPSRDLDADLERAAEVILGAGHVGALTGAGLSVESGIPPFRGPGGLWTKHGEPPLNGFEEFLRDPKAAWQARLEPRGPMRELWETLRAATPNEGHRAFAALERLGLLRILITQNIDNLHRLAGSAAIAEIHGNYTLVRCLGCGARRHRDEVDLSVLPPICPSCNGIVKSDTVSFGEPIPVDVLEVCQQAARDCDCMIVAGTSATVYPAAHFPLQVRERGGALIEVNPYASELTPLCDVSLRGPAGEVLPRLVEAIEQRRRD